MHPGEAGKVIVYTIESPSGLHPPVVNTSPTRPHRIFRSFDRDLSGSVDYHEFCDFLLHGTVAGKKKISIRESRRSGFNNKRSFLFAGRKGKRSRHRQWRGNRTRDGDGTDFSGVEASCSSTPSRWGSSSSSSGSGCKADGGNGESWSVGGHSPPLSR